MVHKMNHRFRFWNNKTMQWDEHQALGLDIFAVYDDSKVYTYSSELIDCLVSDIKSIDNKNIAQGDLIEFENIVYKIMFNKGCFVAVKKDDKTNAKLLYKFEAKASIIGNIFENGVLWQ